MASLEKTEAKPGAIILFGSATNVEDRLDWHKSLAEYSFKALKEGIPVFGICFGHQLMADFFGGKVSRNSVSQYGSREILWSKDWQSLKAGTQLRILKAHSFIVTDPGDLEEVATSEECLFDGLTHKNLPYLSVQGHPEGSPFFIENEVIKEGGTFNDGDIDQALNDGMSLISNFLEFAKRSPHNL